MEIRRGVCSCFVLFATFLTLATLPSTAQAQRRRGGPPTFLTQPDPVYHVSKKVPANITCEALAATSISFTCAGAPVPRASQQTYETYDEARGQTVVRSSIQVTRADISNHQRRLASAGRGREDYWCQCDAENVNTGALRRSSRAIVRLAYMRKRFQEEPASQAVEMGSRAVFRCVAPPGEPTPEIVWRKDNRRIDPAKDDNFVVGADDSLTLVTVRAQDAGRYECAAKNHAVRRISAPAVLTVLEKSDEEQAGEEMTTMAPDDEDGEKPVFLEKPPQKIYLAPNQPFPFTCHIQGTNTMTLRCNGQRVMQDKQDISEDTVNQRVRIVFNLTYADVENYFNRLNEDNYRCECVAWYRSETGERGWDFTTSNVSEIYLASLSEDFEQEPRDLTAQIGDTATLPCEPPEGNPRPWVYWVFGQQRLDPRADARYKVEGDGSLVIQGVRDSDQGGYYCVAENTVGARNSRVGYLTVTSEAAPTPTESYEPTFPAVIPSVPVFTRDLESEYYLNEAGEATLICSVVGAGQLTFRCNDDRVSPERQDIDVRTSPDRRTMLLTATTVVTYDDVYNSERDVYACQCVAWYREGGDWKSNTSTNAVIKLPYLDGEFLYEPQGDVYGVGDTAEFACQPPAGKPTPMVTWLKDGYPINPEEDSNFIILDDNTLIVESVRAQDAGEYVCLAKNTAGERGSVPAVLELYDFSPTTTPPPPTTTTTTQTAPTTTTTFFTTTPYMPGDGETTGTTTTSSMMDGNLPIFTVMPDERVYIMRNQPAVLRCGAMQVAALRFFCNGQRVHADDDDPMQSVDPTPGLTYLEKSIEVTREDVADYAGSEPYTCQCRAYYQTDEGQEGEEDYLSTDTILEMAFLKRRFEQSPEETTAQVGARVELVCRSPQGVPKPEVYWLKDGFRLEDSDNIRVTPEGSLVFEQIDYSDAGDYTCAAENIASTRFSETIAVEVKLMTTPMMTPIDAETTSTTAEPGVVVGMPDGEPDAEEEKEEDEMKEGEPEDGQPETYPEGQPEEGDTEPEGEAVQPETTPESEMESRPGDGMGMKTGNEVEVEGPGEGGMEPMFLAEPESRYYIIKSRPVTIFCQTKRAERITFDCNGNNIPQSLVHYQNNIVEGEENVLMASIEVSREEVENYNNQHDDDFYCQCHAKYSQQGMSEPQYLPSSRGYVEVAYLRKMFRRQPENITASVGDFVSLQCEPPEGNPVPEMKWMKDEEEVFGDLSTPDNALVFQAVSAAEAGTYYCVASNVANVRTSNPASIVVSGAGDVGVEEAGHSIQEGATPEPDAGGDADQMKCVKILKGCSAYMPQTQRDQATSCQTLPRYISCVDDFLQQCGDQMNDESLRSAQMARDTAERACRGEGVCPELQSCQMQYAQQSMPDPSANTMPMKQLCAGIDTFLRCADGALMTCNMSMNDPSTSLSDVATWFQQYCVRVTDGRWDEQCDSLTQCEVPNRLSAMMQNMLQVSLWCPQIHEMMECTTRVIPNCGLPAEDDLEFLTNLASVTCPEPESEAGNVDEDDNDADPDSEDNMDIGKGGEPGKSMGQDEGGNGAWTARASVLLTSLLSVLFAMTACR